MRPGDVVRIGSSRHLYVLGRELHAGWKRRVWSCRTGRACYVSTRRIQPTRYNIHTNPPYATDEPTV